MRRRIAAVSLALFGCAAGPSLEEARLASPSPEVASCAQWLSALDAEVAAAGVRDLQYAAVPGFPYLRTDRFLSASRDRAAASAGAFAAFADRLLDHDLESRRYEIDNLPPASVEKWSGMRLEDSRAAALRRSVQCARLLREVELGSPEMRSALLERAALPPARPPAACGQDVSPRAGAKVRFSPPPSRVARATAAQLLLRAELDPLGQPVVSEGELDALAAAYAPSLELVVASDADRFGAVRWRRGASAPQIDATEPAVYVRRSYARYGERALLQIVYTVIFPENRITWRVTLAPDGEPILYDASGADGCYLALPTPRVRVRERIGNVRRELWRLDEGERPLIRIASAEHRVEALGVVRGTDSLARYALRAYDELRSTPGLDGRQRAAVGRPELDDADRIAARFAFPLEEARP